MDWTIVLDRKTHTLTQEGTRAESRMMYIPPGQVGIISMYNMVEEAVIEGEGADAVIMTKGCARILKVSVARSKNLPELANCGQVIALDREHEKLLAERKITKEPMFQCGQEWNISPCNNMQVITIPGLYIIELFDTDQLDEAYIEFIAVDVATASIIPDSFKLGAY